MRARLLLVFALLCSLAAGHGLHYLQILDPHGNAVAFASVTYGGVKHAADKYGVVDIETDTNMCEIHMEAQGFEPVDKMIEIETLIVPVVFSKLPVLRTSITVTAQIKLPWYRKILLAVKRFFWRDPDGNLKTHTHDPNAKSRPQ